MLPHLLIEIAQDYKLSIQYIVIASGSKQSTKKLTWYNNNNIILDY